MLRRLASVRFGVAIGDRLAAAIGAEADPQRLMDVAEAIVLRHGRRTAAGSRRLRVTPRQFAIGAVRPDPHPKTRWLTVNTTFFKTRALKLDGHYCGGSAPKKQPY